MSESGTPTHLRHRGVISSNGGGQPASNKTPASHLSAATLTHRHSGVHSSSNGEAQQPSLPVSNTSKPARTSSDSEPDLAAAGRANAALDLSNSGASTSSNASEIQQHQEEKGNIPRITSNTSLSSGSGERLIRAIGGSSIALHYFTSQKKLDLSSQDEDSDDDEQTKEEPIVIPPRVHVKSHMYTNGLTMFAMLVVLGLATYNVTSTIIRLKTYYAAVVYLIIPLGVIFFSFAISCAVRGVFSLFLGGTSPLDMNTQNYSAIKTPIPKGAKLPQIVVQMPVYKESLEEVIQLSYFNVKKAMDYYTSKGGTAKYIICDDGFQAIDPKEAIARSRFYAKHNIAYAARPPGNRRGVFKKASNLNYQLAVSDRVGYFMQQDPQLTPEEALLMVWDECDREFVAHGDLTMEEDCLVLLIDADTKVPEHCMYDVVGEFIESPEVAYTQHYTTPFDEQNRNYWEQHISAFTRTIYFQGIAMSVAFGDCCPLVGHNAFLRWSAVRQIGYHDSHCRPNETKYWSENSVSEDFDMYIRLANIGQFGRYVMYTGDDFQEGVSLSYMDEVIKIKKFAYGACEMIFNPFMQWPTKGPFNKGFQVYITNKNIAWYQKTSMLIYLSSYLAMGAAIFYCLFEGVMSVVDPKFHDYFLSRAFDIMLTCTVVFTGIGTFCGGIFYQWRRFGANRHANIFKIMWDQIKWVPSTVLFYNSVLFHVTEVCFIYFFGMKVVWGATAKEATNKTCFQALRETLMGYKWEYLFYVVTLIAYVVCIVWFKISLYRAWSIMSYMVAHIVGPLVLNPYVTSISY